MVSSVVCVCLCMHEHAAMAQVCFLHAFVSTLSAVSTTNTHLGTSNTRTPAYLRGELFVGFARQTRRLELHPRRNFGVALEQRCSFSRGLLHEEKTRPDRTRPDQKRGEIAAIFCSCESWETNRNVGTERVAHACIAQLASNPRTVSSTHTHMRAHAPTRLNPKP